MKTPGKGKRVHGAGILEKVGLVALVGGIADFLATHHAPVWADVLCSFLGLTMLVLSFMIYPDE